MRRITETYEVVRVRRTYVGTCPVCGKKATRSRTFEQSVNPFNITDDGRPKTRAEVRADAEHRADMYTPYFTHTACRGS